MSDLEYTPTTEEVRDVYVDGHWSRVAHGAGHGNFPEAEFDRWLAAHDAEVFDKTVAVLVYEDGSPVEVVAVVNPYRNAGAA